MNNTALTTIKSVFTQTLSLRSVVGYYRSIMIILCPACSETNNPVVINIEDKDKACYCSSCNRRYWIETMTVKQVDEKRIDSAWARYYIKGENSFGRTIGEEFVAQARLPIPHGSVITLVKRGKALVGLANQQSNTWITLRPAPQPKSPWRNLSVFLALVCSLLSLVLIIEIIERVGDLGNQYSWPSLLIGGGLIAFLLLVPLAFIGRR